MTPGLPTTYQLHYSELRDPVLSVADSLDQAVAEGQGRNGRPGVGELLRVCGEDGLECWPNPAPVESEPEELEAASGCELTAPECGSVLEQLDHLLGMPAHQAGPDAVFLAPELLARLRVGAGGYYTGESPIGPYPPAEQQQPPERPPVPPHGGRLTHDPVIPARADGTPGARLYTLGGLSAIRADPGGHRGI